VLLDTVSTYQYMYYLEVAIDSLHTVNLGQLDSPYNHFRQSLKAC